MNPGRIPNAGGILPPDPLRIFVQGEGRRG
jgi:hypothetical protein